MKKTYHLGLLHLAHILINADGQIDEREMAIIRKIKEEEKIDDLVFLEFSRGIAQKKQPEIYARGVDLLNRCTEEEKICAFVYLFQLAEADTSISMREIKMLMLALKATGIDFNDVAMTMNLSTPRSERDEYLLQLERSRS
jgi:uncharacterized tellurite resistance protein B-like protein